MLCSLRPPGLLRAIATVSLTLLVGLHFTVAQAGGAPAAQRQAAGRGWQVFLSASILKAPTGVAIDLRGPKHAAQWGYVADAGTGRIVKFGTGGRVLGSWRYAVPGHPAALTVGGAGNLFVADRVDGTISKFSPAGTRLAFWITKYYVPLFSPPYTDPHSIALDPAGNIYLAEFSEHRIIQLSTSGTLLQTWDTSKGFTTQYSVPHMNSGPLGNPTGVVYDPPGRLFISTVCVTDSGCLTAHYTPVQSAGNDVLLVLSTEGPYSGYVGNFWFGLGYTAAGTPSEAPDKESEAFVHIDAMAGDGKGHTFVAGTVWPRGGQPSLGVLSYTDLGYQTAPWRLPSGEPITGVAVDGSGSVYVSQGSRFLKRSP
jgi:hypothetical protein